MSIRQEAEKKLAEITEKLKENEISFSSPAQKQYNFEITATSYDERVKILVYFGKKGVKTVIQGNNVTPLYKDIDSLINVTTIIKSPGELIKEPDNYIGCDETGKGDFFGPLVTAAVCVNPESAILLLKSGVKDSKKLSDNKIDEISTKIMDICAGKFYISMLVPAEYNRKYSSLGNLNLLLDQLHSETIKNLLPQKLCTEIIIDKFSKTGLSVEKESIAENLKFRYIEKGERYIAVAAASILARSAMNGWFDTMNASGVNVAKGAGSNVDKLASEILRTRGKNFLPEICKTHFKNYLKIKRF